MARDKSRMIKVAIFGSLGVALVMLVVLVSSNQDAEQAQVETSARTGNSQAQAEDYDRKIPVIIGESGTAFDGIVTTIKSIDRGWEFRGSSSSTHAREPKEGTSHVAIDIEVVNSGTEQINVHYKDYSLEVETATGDRRPGKVSESPESFGQDESLGVFHTILNPGDTINGRILYRDVDTDGTKLTLNIDTGRSVHKSE